MALLGSPHNQGPSLHALPCSSSSKAAGGSLPPPGCPTMTWARVEECGFTRTVMHQHVQSTSLQHSFQAGRHRPDSLHALPCSDRMQGEDTHSIELSEGRRVQVGGCQHLCQLRLLLLQNVAHCTAAARGGCSVQDPTRQSGADMAKGPGHDVAAPSSAPNTLHNSQSVSSQRPTWLRSIAVQRTAYHIAWRALMAEAQGCAACQIIHQDLASGLVS